MKQKKGIDKKGMAVTLATVMVCSAAIPVQAADTTPNTEKEEVVYANLEADGTIKEINVVNIFDLKAAGRIVDYGNYENLRNMTTTDAIDYSGDTVKIDAKPGKLYYEGKLKETQLPWNISVTYYLDGKKCTPEELAGKDGALKIALKITENSDYEGNFFDSYALQTSFTLDTEQCSNIVAEDATVANVGSQKQLTYTILPGKGIDTEVTADVTDFTMDGIAINGIPLSLNVDVDDEALMDQVTELLDAIEQLDDGAGELQEGAEKLASGGTDLKSGVNALDTGVTKLDTGAKALNSGVAQVQSGLIMLNEKSSSLTGGSSQFQAALETLQTALSGVSTSASEVQTLVTSSAQIKAGIDQIAGGAAELQNSVNYNAYKQLMAQNGLDIDTLQTNNANMITMITSMMQSGQMSQELGGQMIALIQANQACIAGTETYLNQASVGIGKVAGGAAELQKNYAAFDAAIGELASTLTNLSAQMENLKTAVNTLAAEYEKLDSGINEYTDGVSAILNGYQQVSAGASELAAGSSELKSGSGSLSSGTTTLVDGIIELYEATGILKDGTGTMREETSGMDTKITDQIDELLDSVTGGDLELTSFVSEKNTNIDSVQFVIKTESIQEEEEKEPVEEETKELNFRQKFLKLFGIYKED